MLRRFRKKVSAFLLTTMLASLCFNGNTISLQAQEGYVSYIFAQKDGGEAKWYIGDPVIGYTDEISTDTMQKDEHTIYNICATPTPELNSFLQSLTTAHSINFFECGAGSVSFGDAVSPISLNYIQICDPDINVTATVSYLGQLDVDKGTVTINGNVSNLQLGHDAQMIPGGIVTQSATINGNVSTLTWYNNPAMDRLSFKGNCTVTGTVSEGLIKEATVLPDFGEIYPVTRTFTNVTNTSIITNGVLNSSIACDGVDNLANSTITYDYSCYCWKGWIGNYWEKSAYADGYYLGSMYLDNFNPATDIPANASVYISGTCGNEPVTISTPLNSLTVVGGNINVTEDVNLLTVSWYYADKTLYDSSANIKITGNVAKMYLHGSCKEVNVTANGTIAYGERIIGGIPAYFTSDGSVNQIMRNGKLMLMSNNSSSYDGINYLLPSVTDVENTLGITENDNIVNESGNVIAIKTASVDISQLDSVSEEEKKLFADNGSTSVLSWIDVGVSSFYQDSYGSIYEDQTHTTQKIHELSQPITITIEVPTEYRNSDEIFTVLRNHNGVITELADTDTNPNTVTFETDRFSTYALAKANEESNSNTGTNNSTGNNTPTQGNTNNGTSNNISNSQGSSSTTGNSSQENNTQKIEPVYYTVLGGDTLTKIARRHDMTLKELIALNPQIKNINKIYPGQKILVKEGTASTEEETTDVTYHIVRRGDSLYKICRQYRIPVAKIIELNPQIKNPNLIFTGQKVNLK